MSVQVAPPLVVMSRNPPAGADRDAIQIGRAHAEVVGAGAEAAGERGGRARWAAIGGADQVQFKPPLLLLHTRALEKWKKTRPVASRLAGAGTIAVKNPKPTSRQAGRRGDPVLKRPRADCC